MPRLVDLTQTFRAGMRGVAWDTAATVDREGWNARTLHLYSHAGTHMDAQAHFAAGPETIDCIPLEGCMGPAWVVDIPGLAPRALITVDHLGEVRAAISFRRLSALAHGLEPIRGRALHLS